MAGGGDHINGAGGYSGGNAQYNNTHIPTNGEAGNIDDDDLYASGSGYFSVAPNNIPEGITRENVEEYDRKTLVPGIVLGMGGFCNEYTLSWHFTYGGDGGVAGKGGIITITNFNFREKSESETDEQYMSAKVIKLKEKIKAYNGNRYTDELTGHEEPRVNPANQCPIYAQRGILNEIQKTLGWWTNEDNAYYGRILGKTFNYTTTWENGANVPVVLRSATTCATTPYGLGIGSGAGYIETDNGSLSF